MICAAFRAYSVSLLQSGSEPIRFLRGASACRPPYLCHCRPMMSAVQRSYRGRRKNILLRFCFCSRPSRSADSVYGCRESGSYRPFSRFLLCCAIRFPVCGARVHPVCQYYSSSRTSASDIYYSAVLLKSVFISRSFRRRWTTAPRST